jgi:hypothetical protein
LNFHFEDTKVPKFDYSLQPIFYRMVPFEDIKISTLLIDNDGVTALFLAKYFAIKFATGHSFRDVINPVVKDLRRLVFKTLFPSKKLFYVDVTRTGNFLSYRSFLFKKLLFKNFLLYKILYIKFYKNYSSFFNFYML